MSSFCESDDDRTIHSSCVVEKAVSILARPWPVKATAESRRHFYRSRIFDDLRVLRNRRLGVPEDIGEADLATRLLGRPWELEIDPCEVRRIWRSINEREQYIALEGNVLDQQREMIQREIVYHCAGNLTVEQLDPLGHMEVVSDFVQAEYSKIGFRRDVSRAGPDHLSFSKAVTEGWDLQLSLAEPRRLIRGPRAGFFRLALTLQPVGLKKPILDCREGEFLAFRIDMLIPGFHAYRNFESFLELLLFVKAHARLYQLVAPQLEASVREGLLLLS